MFNKTQVRFMSLVDPKEMNKPAKKTVFTNSETII